MTRTKDRRITTACFASLLLLSAAKAADLPMVNESARQIPVACSVDVLVVGGSTGAVSAAVAAADSGAKVFLAAPRPYLGDDMTATLQLWLEEGETPVAPLAKRLYRDPVTAARMPSARRIPFRYQADQPTSERHRDTPVPSLLCDGAWGDPVRQSVQYDEDVNLTLELDEARQIGAMRLWAYHQTGPAGYRVGSVTVASSDGRNEWRELAVISNPQDQFETSICLEVPIEIRTDRLRLSVKKAPGAARILLGEIELLAPPSPADEAVDGRQPWPRPMHVKRVLDQALLDAGVDFLYNCFATDLLTDDQGQPCGIVMANRAGRQAVIAKTMIDATERSLIARLAGAKCRPYPAGPQTFRRVVIGSPPIQCEGVNSRTIQPPFTGPVRTSQESGIYPIVEYTLSLPMSGDTDASWGQADQQARTITYQTDQQFTADALFQVPPDPIAGQQTAQGEWPGVDRLPLGAFRPQAVARLLMVNGCADVPRAQAERLLRPLALIDLGARLGKEAADEATRLPPPQNPTVRGTPSEQPAQPGDVRETLTGVRPNQKAATIAAHARALPVLGSYDVVVIGGGTAGAPAGIAAARQGAKTMVVEQLSALGGVGTAGAISIYCSGNRVGFTASVPGNPSWVIEQRMEWWRSELLKAGADIWFGAIGCGAFMNDDSVAGAVVATPRGRGVVLAKVVVDATGNADVAAAAGAECVYTDESEFAMQGTGLPPRQLGAGYTNTDYTFTDETDMVDVWHLYIHAKDKFPEAFDLGQLIDTRERRRIVGDFTLTILDQASGRRFPDTIAQAAASYDTHGYIVDPYLLLQHPRRQVFTSDIPYRSLLPKGLEGLIVTGIALSAHRDAQPIVRMQPDIQNQGYAAGAAAAMAAKAGTLVRNIDIRQLQRHLVEIGNLPESVLADQDSHPLPAETVAAAVARFPDDYRSLAIILGHRDVSLPLLEAAWRDATGDKKLAYAKVLAMMGDQAGLETLLAAVEEIDEWDNIPAWNAPAGDPDAAGAGWSMSRLDNMLVALGRTRSPQAAPAVLKKLAMLEPATTFSHHRAVYLALEWLGDRRAAAALAKLLLTPGMGGYAVTSIDERELSSRSRSPATRELILARTLYRCGDHEGLGRQTLEQYSRDLRGHFARHAQAVLNAGPDHRPGP